MPACACPHADRGEGRGEGENPAISSSYVPLSFIPSHQGRGNPTFYECINHDALVKSPRRVTLRSGATKNLNDIKFFAIAQNDKRVFL